MSSLSITNPVLNRGIRLTSLLIFFFLSCSVLAQESTVVTAKFIDAELTVDGVMDEPQWEYAEEIGNFWQFFPTDSVRSQNRTSVKILYSESTLYVGVYAEAKEGDFVVSSLRRDFSGSSNDNVSVIFDTFSDGSNAFLFGATPYGVQREVLISDGGSENGFNATWDMKWRTESTMYDDHYVAEMAIPFTSLKFEEGVDTWRFQCYRWDFQSNEQSAWARVPQNQLLSSLAFMKELRFEKPLGKSRTPFALIPYVNGLASKDYTTGESNTKLSVGADAKVAIGNGMNLDLTVNPDFSNVEVDDIFTNLTRFEVFLPEKRQFFIDNSDLFGNFGSGNDALPFFSRRIGLARNADGNLIENRIVAGARLSGKLNENWRLGLLNIQTDEDVSNEIPSNNNAMIALQRKVFARSNVGVFMVNRQAFKDYEFLDESDEFNRVIGAEFNLASANNVFSGKAYIHKSFQPNDSEGNISTKAYLVYNTRNWRLATDIVYVDEDFRADLGFVPRTGVLKSGNSITRTFYAKQGAMNTNSLRLLSLIYWRPNLDYQKTDHEFRFSWNTAFKNQAETELRLSNNYIFLVNEFDPTRSGGLPLPSNRGYEFNQLTASYNSNPSNMFTYGAEFTAGEFYTGNLLSANAEVGYRLQPWANIGAQIRYDQIRLPEPHADANIWLVSPKVDIIFSKSLFWSTLFQYSNQRNNFGVNSRLQWRFAPLSDLYLVYNDNYQPNDFSPTFRSINVKMTYWLNIAKR
ncbi:DUF5916 domain-containing protein [Roseivirga pacifica]|uniref:DUF5916 domain-containing protein n=1 Tax=Roseivirga pacifica TaxID=1267423 RepID=UPI003BAA94B7